MGIILGKVSDRIQNRSLFLKISISVGVVVTLSLAFFAYFLIENQREHLLYAKSKEIEILSDWGGVINSGPVSRGPMTVNPPSWAKNSPRKRMLCVVPVKP